MIKFPSLCFQSQFQMKIHTCITHICTPPYTCISSMELLEEKHQRKGGKHKEENKNVEKQKKAAKELNNTAQQHKRYLSTIFCRCVNVFRWG